MKESLRRKQEAFPEKPAEGEALGEATDLGLFQIPEKELMFGGGVNEKKLYLEVTEGAEFQLEDTLPKSVSDLIMHAVEHERSLRGGAPFLCLVDIRFEEPSDTHRNPTPHFDLDRLQNASIYVYSSSVGTIEYPGVYKKSLHDSGSSELSGEVSAEPAEEWVKHPGVVGSVHPTSLLPQHLYHAYASRWLHSEPFNKFTGKFKDKRRFFLRITCLQRST